MKKNSRKIITLILAAVLAAGMTPAAVMADEISLVSESDLENNEHDLRETDSSDLSDSQETYETGEFENDSLKENEIQSVLDEDSDEDADLSSLENDSEIAGSEEPRIEIQEDNISAESSEPGISYEGFSSDYRKYTIELENVTLRDGDRIIVPVWSEAKGQDDIRWNTAVVKADGTVKIELNISDYKSPGKFFADFYRVNTKGEYQFVFGTTFMVETARSASVKLTKLNKRAGSATVRITDIDSPAGIQSVFVPTWSRNDQSNICWYAASQKKDGSYELTFKIADHMYDWANYYSDVYVTDNNGFRSFVGGTEADFTVTAQKPLVSVDEAGGTCTVTISVDDLPPGLSRMVVPVWSAEGGQDDLKWIDMTADNANNFSATFGTGFLKHSGTCFADVYAAAAGGGMIFMSGETFEVNGASAGSVKAAADQSSGRFTVTVSGINNLPKDASVIVPVWCADDQSDIVWYTAAKKGSSYVAEGNISNHKYSVGEYKVDVYSRSSYMCFMGGTTMNFAASNGSFALTDKYAGENGKEQTEYRGTLSGLLIPGGFTSVQAAVWSDKGGQDDITWYTMKKQSDGTLAFDLPIKNHKTAGAYYIHIYAVTKSGKYQFVSAYNDLFIDGVDFNAAVTVENADPETGTF